MHVPPARWEIIKSDPDGGVDMQREDKRQILQALGMVTTISLNMVATVVVGLVLGRLADSWLGTAPWCTVSGIVLGMLTGLWATYKRILHL